MTDTSKVINRDAPGFAGHLKIKPFKYCEPLAKRDINNLCSSRSCGATDKRSLRCALCTLFSIESIYGLKNHILKLRKNTYPTMRLFSFLGLCCYFYILASKNFGVWSGLKCGRIVKIILFYSLYPCQVQMEITTVQKV